MTIWDDWKRQYEIKLQEKLKPAPPKAEAKKVKESASKRSITAAELQKLRKLQKVSTAWWCGDGRFIRQFQDATSETLITERQAWYIRVLWYKYRRQLGHDGPRPEGYG